MILVNSLIVRKELAKGLPRPAEKNETQAFPIHSPSSKAPQRPIDIPSFNWSTSDESIYISELSSFRTQISRELHGLALSACLSHCRAHLTSYRRAESQEVSYIS
jgi:hypothetical protein